MDNISLLFLVMACIGVGVALIFISLSLYHIRKIIKILEKDLEKY